MRYLILSAALLAAVPNIAAAQDAAPAAATIKASDVKVRTVVWDKDGARIGSIISVNAAADGSPGSVTVILGESPTRIPGSTLSIKDGKLASSLTRRDVLRSR